MLHLFDLFPDQSDNPLLHMLQLLLFSLAELITMTIKQVRVLTLNAGENRETTLYRLEKGRFLQSRENIHLCVTIALLFGGSMLLLIGTESK